jgi:hypothetical protein
LRLDFDERAAPGRVGQPRARPPKTNSEGTWPTMRPALSEPGAGARRAAREQGSAALWQRTVCSTVRGAREY